MSELSKGEQMLGIIFVKGNNSTEQNDLEATAHLINRFEKARHLGENFNYETNSVENLNWAIDQAQTYLRKSAIFLKEALEMNQQK